ncbi:unnamed protein product [Owenia fusiformis]|uniref:Uncharacterized protein n=1 Tax=Owenia fusiformis TaxID=6347 RepID=A0A8J1UB53_OWEFU|nr:unnamed protein product [Owenia fusiformis]
MLFGLVLLVQVVGTVFRGSTDKQEGPRRKENKGTNMRAQIRKNELKLEQLEKTNKMHEERTDALKAELKALEESFVKLNNIVQERMAHFEHLESVTGVCHCNECIIRDTFCIETREEEKIEWMNRNKKFVPPQTEEFWIE